MFLLASTQGHSKSSRTVKSAENNGYTTAYSLPKVAIEWMLRNLSLHSKIKQYNLTTDALPGTKASLHRAEFRHQLSQEPAFRL